MGALAGLANQIIPPGSPSATADEMDGALDQALM
jgi:hypothetical protein